MRAAAGLIRRALRRLRKVDVIRVISKRTPAAAQHHFVVLDVGLVLQRF
jgi:flavin-binding protein dodecin